MWEIRPTLVDVLLMFYFKMSRNHPFCFSSMLMEEPPASLQQLLPYFPASLSSLYRTHRAHLEFPVVAILPDSVPFLDTNALQAHHTNTGSMALVPAALVAACVQNSQCHALLPTRTLPAP